MMIDGALFGGTGAVCVSALFAGMIVAMACSRSTVDKGDPQTSLNYPPTKRFPQVDNYHGVEVPDPYRWLEELDAEPTRQWVDAQNLLAKPFLETIPARERIHARLTELWNHERSGVPWRRAGHTFYFRNDGLADQDVLWVVEEEGAEPRVLLDPNRFSDDGTVALAGVSTSPDARFLAYAISDGGSDWRDWQLREVASGRETGDLLTHIKFTSISWQHDASGFYYSRYPTDPAGNADGSQPVRVFRHRLGAPQSEDEEIFAQPEYPGRNPYADVSEDGRWLVITIAEGSLENAVWLRDLSQPDGGIRPFFDDWDARYDFLASDGSTLYFRTTNDAPLGRVIAVDAGRRENEGWREVIPETTEVLENASAVGGRFFAQYLSDATSRVEVWLPSGRRERELELPGVGSAAGFGGPWHDTATFFSFESFIRPAQIYRQEVASAESSLFFQPQIPVDFDAFETRQVFVTSKDGTRVPLFLTHRKGMELDGSNPTLLYGYGGFDISLTPTYSTSRMVWMEMGGVFAVANLRGGGEYGEEWHLAGARLNKQNVFDDFIAAAEWLIESGVTSAAKLAIEGGSNGGLLVGAAMTQRPELFGAALPAVGVLDMLRYHLPSANARNWSDDYGLSEIKEDFEVQISYSPLHNLEDGRCYPPTLITTGDHDDRVVPWHSYKFAAELQSAQGCEQPVLLRVETRAGHGAGKPTWMIIENLADRYAFAVLALGMDPS